MITAHGKARTPARNSAGFITAGDGPVDDAGDGFRCRLQIVSVGKRPAACGVRDMGLPSQTVISETDVRGGVRIINSGEFAGDYINQNQPRNI